jgi:hypothetical protein
MKEQLATFRSQLEEFARKHKVIHSAVFSLMSKEKENLMTIVICLKLQTIRWLLNDDIDWDYPIFYVIISVRSTLNLMACLGLRFVNSLF